jgi:hypothetical protein
MATFLRRKLTQLNEVRKGKTDQACTFMRPEGSVTFSAKESSRYGMLMTMLDSDTDGQIGGLEGASFLRRSGLGTGKCFIFYISISDLYPIFLAHTRDRERERERERDSFICSL